MVTHRSIAIRVLALPLAVLALLAACDKVPLLAPTGSVITILPATTTVSLNSEINIVATVIENGQASGTTGTSTGTTTTSRPGAGTPVQNGTLITFTTTLGRIEPSEARTHNGEVTVKLITGGGSGTATVTAYSGGASASTQLKIGTAAAGRVLVTTSPQALGASGGTTQVAATVTDEGGNPLFGIPVTFATDKGSISPSTATTDAGGVAIATLSTTATANITATAGAQSGKATVTVNARSLASFTASPAATTAGTPVTFTVTPTTGANISNVHVEFGDGRSTDLGAIGAATTTQNTYTSSGNYTATATARDAVGESQPLSASISIGSLPVTLTASPNPTTPDTPTTFTVGGVTTAQVDHYLWTWDDGTDAYTTGSPQTTHTFTTRGTKTIRVDVFGVGGGKLGSQQISMTVQ
jgi:hypothetical protein